MITPQHKEYKYKKEFEPCLVKLEERDGKWKIDAINPTSWIQGYIK